MLVVKNRLIFGMVKRFIVGIFKFIYKIISFINFQLPLLVCMIGLVLFLTGALTENQTARVIFFVCLAVSAVISVCITLRKIFKPKVTKKKGVQIVSEGEIPSPETPSAPPAVTQTKPVYPKYYAVRQNKNYVMAEYEDKYLLYLKTQDGLKLVRTDYK